MYISHSLSLSLSIYIYIYMYTQQFLFDGFILTCN